MNDPTFLLLAIIGFFIVLLIAKEASHKAFCVLCVSVSLTWMLFLALFWLGVFREPVALGVLLGESVFGVYHLFEKHTKEDWHLFRLPVLLTLTILAFLALGVFPQFILTLGVLLLVWAATIVLFVSKGNPRVANIAKRIISCCKNW